MQVSESAPSIYGLCLKKGKKGVENSLKLSIGLNLKNIEQSKTIIGPLTSFPQKDNSIGLEVIEI